MGTPARGHAALAAVLAVAALGAAVAVGFVALRTERGQDLDDRAMRVFSVNGTPGAARPLVTLLEGLTIGTAAVALAGFVVLALLRGRYAVALGTGVLVAGANVTTQVLKDAVLDRPDLGHGTLNSLPSGHTTLVFSLVLAAVLAAPAALRGVMTLLGAGVGTLTGMATVADGWHRPADVVTGLLVTLGWGAAVVAVLPRFPAGGAGRRAGSAWVPATLGVLAAAVLVVTLGIGPGPGPGELLAAALTLGSIGLTALLAVGAFTALVARDL